MRTISQAPGQAKAHSPSVSASAAQGMNATQTEQVVTVNRRPFELRTIWKDVVEAVQPPAELAGCNVEVAEQRPTVAPTISSATGPVTAHEATAHIAWNDADDRSACSSGIVRLSAAPGGRGTEVRVTLPGTPAGRKLGKTLAKLLAESRRRLRATLRHLKQLLEAGEVPTTDGQPTGKVTRAAEEA
jgi:uncharacterized membrane protein